MVGWRWWLWWYAPNSVSCSCVLLRACKDNFTNFNHTVVVWLFICGLDTKDNVEKSVSAWSIPCTTSWNINIKISYIEKSGCTQLEIVLKIRTAADKSGPGDAPASVQCASLHTLHCISSNGVSQGQKHWYKFRSWTSRFTSHVIRVPRYHH